MEIKLKINVDKILDETGITIDEPEQWLALMDRGIENDEADVETACRNGYG